MRFSRAVPDDTSSSPEMNSAKASLSSRDERNSVCRFEERPESLGSLRENSALIWKNYERNHFPYFMHVMQLIYVMYKKRHRI
jgi:hypothetical protein